MQFVNASGKEPAMVRRRNLAPGWLLPLLLVGSMVAAAIAVAFVSTVE